MRRPMKGQMMELCLRLPKVPRRLVRWQQASLLLRHMRCEVRQPIRQQWQLLGSQGLAHWHSQQKQELAQQELAQELAQQLPPLPTATQSTKRWGAPVERWKLSFEGRSPFLARLQ